MPIFSKNVLKYLALEEDEDVQVVEKNSHFLPLKDECPLEDPVTFTKKTEPIKKAPAKANSKTLNEIGLDEQEIEFQVSSPEAESESSDEPEDSSEETDDEATKIEESTDSNTTEDEEDV